MSKLGVVISETYKRNVKSVSFIIMILMPFIFVGLSAFFGTMAAGMGSKTEIAIIATPEAQDVQEFLAPQMNSFKINKQISSEAEAQKALQNEEINGYLKISVKNYQLNSDYFSTSTMGSENETELTQAMNHAQSLLTAAKLDLTPEQLQSLSTPAVMKINKVSFDEQNNMQKDGDNSIAMRLLAIFVVIFMFFIVYTYAAIAAQEIASEKGTRIMEVILSSTDATVHFYGKLIAIVLVSLTQIAVYGVAFLLFSTLSKKLVDLNNFMTTLPPARVMIPFIACVGAYFLLGILIYTALAALSGSLVSKAEDAPKAVMPIVYLLMAGYMVGFVFGMSDPHSLILKICSYIPFLSSTTMPVRLAYGAASTADVVSSLLILAVSSILVIIFSAKLYKTNVLVYSEGGFFKSLTRSLSILKAENKKS